MHIHPKAPTTASTGAQLFTASSSMPTVLKRGLVEEEVLNLTFLIDLAHIFAVWRWESMQKSL